MSSIPDNDGCLAVPPSNVQGLDLFAGAGGLSLGAQLAGVCVTHAVEMNAAAAETYRINHSKTVVIQKDIRTFFPRRLGREVPTVLFGGPPCQGFSTSNQRTRTADNPKNWLFAEFFRIARYCKPDWIVLENVKGLRETAQGKFEALIRNQMEDLGYTNDLWVLCAADFGVPQKRQRLFFVGRRQGQLPPHPKAGSKVPVTVRQAIGDLPVLEVGADTETLGYRSVRPSAFAMAMRGKCERCTGHLVTLNNKLVQRRYLHIPPGGNWRDIPKRLMRNYTNLVNDRSRHTGIYRRLVWDEPAIVIANFRKNMLVHPEQNRGLSVREAARLQSFPDRYIFSGSIGLRQQQISNAVPPLLAKAVFTQILAYL